MSLKRCLVITGVLIACSGAISAQAQEDGDLFPPKTTTHDCSVLPNGQGQMCQDYARKGDQIYIRYRYCSDPQGGGDCRVLGNSPYLIVAQMHETLEFLERRIKQYRQSGNRTALWLTARELKAVVTIIPPAELDGAVRAALREGAQMPDEGSIAQAGLTSDELVTWAQNPNLPLIFERALNHEIPSSETIIKEVTRLNGQPTAVGQAIPATIERPKASKPPGASAADI